MKKLYTRRYLKKDNTVSSYQFYQEIKHLDASIKQLKQQIRPLINSLTKTQLETILDTLKSMNPAPEKGGEASGANELA